MGNRRIQIEREWEFVSPSQPDPKKRCWKLWHSVCQESDFFTGGMHYDRCLEMEKASAPVVTNLRVWSD
ncbi:hypothetical protein N7499_008247 [Penicillium canescens]|nr:hypothetical protein N7499_008247 [Penicillium canescens]KAJ6158578.1 hypothetical protein N7485_011404 [Penicillium canescens]